MIRETVALQVLRSLALSKGYKVPQQALFESVRIATGERLSHEDLVETVQFCEGRGWLASDVNTFGKTRHWITDSGEIERSRYA